MTRNPSKFFIMAFKRKVRLKSVGLRIWALNLVTPSKKVPSNNLLAFYKNVHSQAGQDGILEEIFNRLRLTKGYFVEFGAWDGAYLSNCKFLVECGWTGVFIEGDPARFRQLLQNYPSKDIVKINQYVGYTNQVTSDYSGPTLASILFESEAKAFMHEIDFVGIDVDGVDLEIAISMGISPKVIAVEGGSVFNPNLKLPFPGFASNFQHPLAYIFDKLGEIGYTPVSFHQDVIAVRNDLVGGVFDEVINKTPEEFFSDSWHFLDRQNRSWQLWKRYLSPEVRNFEIEATGRFSISPT